MSKQSFFQLLRSSVPRDQRRGRSSAANKMRRLLRRDLAMRQGGFATVNHENPGYGRRWFAPCYWCQTTLPLPDLTVDHLTRIADGGAKLDLANLVLACARCNSGRHHRLLEPSPARPTNEPEES